MMDNNMYTDGVCGPTGESLARRRNSLLLSAALCASLQWWLCAGARVWLIIGLMASFAGFIAATWIMAQVYLPHHKESGGVSLFMQNFLILLSSFIFKFGRTNDMY